VIGLGDPAKLTQAVIALLVLVPPGTVGGDDHVQLQVTGVDHGPVEADRPDEVDVVAQEGPALRVPEQPGEPTGALLADPQSHRRGPRQFDQIRLVGDQLGHHLSLVARITTGYPSNRPRSLGEEDSPRLGLDHPLWPGEVHDPGPHVSDGRAVPTHQPHRVRVGGHREWSGRTARCNHRHGRVVPK